MFPLAEVGLSPARYVLYVADEEGPWRGLADATRDIAFAVAPVFERLVMVAGEADIDAPTDECRHHLVDLLYAWGQTAPDETADRLAAALGSDDAALRRRTLNALGHLEYRYATGRRLLLEHDAVREAVVARRDDPERGVRDRAEAVDTLYGCHDH